MKNLLLMAMLALPLLSCTPIGNGDTPKDPTPEDPGFVARSYNGYFVEALAKAYDSFLETDQMPRSINVEGLNYNMGKYVGGACLLIEKIASDPKGWQDEEIELPERGAASSETRYHTYDPDVISLEDLRYMAGAVMAYHQKNDNYPNFCTMPGKYVELDGTEHDNRITFQAMAVLLSRALKAYTETGELPAEISSWPSDYLHSTRNCDIADPLVVSTMQEVTAGCTSELQMAKALFDYSRDEWEWENYYNSSRGAVKTIRDKAGNCCDLSHALIAMCRAAGLPARYMHGMCQFQSGEIGHVFVEIYAAGSWHLCDPSNNSNQFDGHNWKHMNTFNGRYSELPF